MVSKDFKKTLIKTRKINKKKSEEIEKSKDVFNFTTVETK